MSARSIKVTIDELVLRGVDQHRAQALAESLKTELARTFAQPESRQSLERARDAPVLRLDPMALSAGRTAARTFGTNLARAIAKGVGR
jgi:hypothetical protein